MAKTNAEEAIKSLEPFAKVLQKGVGQLWKMFVMRYVAKGLAQVFLAIFINCAFVFLYWPTYKFWMIVPLGVAALLIYDAIQLLTNPYYFAMNDVLYRLKNESSLWKS